MFEEGLSVVCGCAQMAWPEPWPALTHRVTVGRSLHLWEPQLPCQAMEVIIPAPLKICGEVKSDGGW